MTPPSRSAATRWSKAVALASVTALTLTGCMKMQYDLTLNPDDTGSVSMVMAVSDEFAESMGMSPEELWAEMGASEDAPEGASEEPYAEDGYTGVRYTVAEAPIDQLSDPTTLVVERVGDEYLVTGQMDLTEMTSEVDPEDPAAQAMLDTLAVELSVTFPGAVGEHNGTLDGTTVTWTPVAGEVTDLSARGSALPGAVAPTQEVTEEPTDEPTEEATEGTDEPTDAVTAAPEDEGDEDSGAGFPWWILLVGGALLLLAIAGITLLVVRGRRSAATPATGPATALPPAQAWQQAPGPGAQVPPAGWAQPPAPQGWAPPQPTPPEPTQVLPTPPQPTQVLPTPPPPPAWSAQPTEVIQPAAPPPPPAAEPSAPTPPPPPPPPGPTPPPPPPA